MKKKTKKQRENFWKRNYSKSWSFLKESRIYVWIAVLIFLVFTLIGFAFPVFFQEKILDLMKNLGEMFFGLNVFETIGLIFLNNLKASFFVIIFGFALGVVPLLSGVSNGYILGFVARYSVGENGVGVLWRILPHGIFELPAILMSIGLGLKIGTDVLRRDEKKDFRRNMTEALRFFIFVVLPLLLVAAVIEGLLVFYVG